MNEQEHKLYLKKLKNCKGARYLTLFFINIYNRTSEEGFKREIFADDMDYNDILINEASKPILNDNQTIFKNFLNNLDKSFHIDMINFEHEKKKKNRKVNLIYVSLLKFNGLIRYMLYQGLTKEDIRKASYYIKHQFFKKGEYIFRQYEKSDALYGIIKGKIQIRTVNFKDLTQKFHGDLLKGEGLEDNKNLDNNIPINYFMSDVEIANSSSESEENNDGYFALRKRIEKEIIEKEKKDKEIQDKLKKSKSRKSFQRMKTTIVKSNFNIINTQNKNIKRNYLRLNTMKNINTFDKKFNILNNDNNNSYNKSNFNRNKNNFNRMKTTIIKSNLEINNDSSKKFKKTNSMRKLILKEEDSENTINFEENFSEKENKNYNSKIKFNKSLSFRFNNNDQKNKTNIKKRLNRLNTVNINFNKNILNKKENTSSFFKEFENNKDNDENKSFEEKKDENIFDFSDSDEENDKIFIQDESKMIENKRKFFYKKKDESNDFSFTNDFRKDSISINSNSNSPINSKKRKVKFEMNKNQEQKKEKSNFFNNLFNEDKKEKEEELKLNNKKINKNFKHSKSIKINDGFKKFQEKFFNSEQKEEENEKNNIDKNIDFSIKKSNIKKRKIYKSFQSNQTPDNITDPKVLFNLIEDFESKKMDLIPGYCFGEWGLIYNIPRTTSIYCIEDTDVFYLEKKYFDKILLKKFHLSDLKKIQFIYDRLPILKKYSNNSEHILTKITPFFFDEGDIVYTPYDNANTLYLIYLGECYLCEMPIKTTNKIDYLQKKNKLVRVNTVTEGGIVGLESCLPEKKYEHCLYVVQNFTILLKLDTDYFQSIFDNFKESITNLYYRHKNIMQEFHNRNEKIRKELNFKYRLLKNKKKQFFEEFYKDKTIVNGKNDKDIIHRINSSRILKISETRNIFKNKLKKHQNKKENKNNEYKKNLKLNYYLKDKNQNKKSIETENIKIPKILLKSPIKIENKLYMTNFNTINAKESQKNNKNKNLSFNNNEIHDSGDIKSNNNKKKIKLNLFRNKSIEVNKKLNSRTKFFNSPIKNNNNFDSITNFSSTKTKSNITSVNFKKKLSNFPKINSLNNASSYFNISNISNSISSKHNISHKRITSFDSGLFNIPFITSLLKE